MSKQINPEACVVHSSTEVTSNTTPTKPSPSCHLESLFQWPRKTELQKETIQVVNNLSHVLAVRFKWYVNEECSFFWYTSHVPSPACICLLHATLHISILHLHGILYMAGTQNTWGQGFPIQMSILKCMC